MSYSIDLSLLLCSVDEDSPVHKPAKRFLITVLDSEELCVLSWETIYGFVRISTHRGIFRNPLSTQIAISNMQSLIDHPRVEVVSTGRLSWNIFVRLTGELSIKGNLVPDALLASLLEANGVKRLYTRDRDFRKFDYLEPVDPVS